MTSRRCVIKTLRPYQESAVRSLFDWLFSTDGNPLIVAPVGSGKSLMIAEFIKRVHDDYPRTKIIMLSHVKELLVQDAQEMMEQYPDADFGFYCAGLGEKKAHNDITFASIQSVWDKIDVFPAVPKIIIVDEAHLIPHNTLTRYRRFMDDVLNLM